MSELNSCLYSPVFEYQVMLFPSFLPLFLFQIFLYIVDIFLYVVRTLRDSLMSLESYQLILCLLFSLNLSINLSVCLSLSLLPFLPLYYYLPLLSHSFLFSHSFSLFYSPFLCLFLYLFLFLSSSPEKHSPNSASSSFFHYTGGLKNIRQVQGPGYSKSQRALETFTMGDIYCSSGASGRVFYSFFLYFFFLKMTPYFLFITSLLYFLFTLHIVLPILLSLCLTPLFSSLLLFLVINLYSLFFSFLFPLSFVIKYM